ncbi:MAG: VCBS repeat-containing protein [Acidobacteria bacterium]|nr:VCBS repeat-containing protein [Acidobacteriota bacterium]
MLRTKLLVVFIFALAFLAFKFPTPPTVSGQANVAVPTGFTATNNMYNNKIGLYWDTIRGATSYRIFRNTTNNSATATEIAVTAAPFFFDTTAAGGQTFFYWIRAENGSVTSPLSAPVQGARTNTVQQGPIPPIEPPPPAPGANPLTATKAYLGKALFWDEQLSATKTVSCGTCHRANTGGTDPRSLVTLANAKNPGFDSVYNTADDVVGSPGVPLANADGSYIWSANYGMRDQVTGRKANSHINAVYAPVLFWDGRASGTFRDPITNNILINAGGALESQVLGPPVSETEMGHVGRNWQEVADKITTARPLALASNIPTPLQTWIGGRTYPELFQEAFGTPDVTPARIAMAIGTYERTLFSDQTPVDLANAGIQPLGPVENRGRAVFAGNACGACHAGSLLSDNTFRNIGLRPVTEDTGRFQVTGANNNRGQFRVPSLRNVGLRSSYMHNGRFGALEDVVEFYNRGGDFPGEPNFAAGLVAPRNLTAQQKSDLVAFLRNSLTDDRVRNELPPFDRPQLYSESNRVPAITGTGVAGTGGQIPAAIAIEPPLVGNPSFTVGVASGLGGANAVLVINSTDPGTASIPATGSFTRRTLTLGGSGAGNGNASVVLQIPNDQALVGQTFFGRWYVTDAGAAGGFSVSPAFRFTVFGQASAAPRAGFVDFDGDRKTDISVFRPADGSWWYSKSGDGQTLALQFGTGTDKIVPGDYTGDGKTDVAVFRPSTGTWYVLRSEDNSFFSVPFGAAGDMVAPGDYDGDGRADFAVFRPTTGEWFIQASSQGTRIDHFGAAGDIPQIGDYDGDGKADIAVFRPSNGQWWLNRSTAGVVATTFGVSTDKPVAQDFTGDGKTDIAFYRPASGEWFVLRSEDGSFFSVPFGISTDVPAPGDYDGDGKADFAVFRSGTWYINRSTNGLLIAGFGASGDTPAPAAFVP